MTPLFLVLAASFLGIQTDPSSNTNESSLLKASSSASFTQSVWLDLNWVKLHLTNRGGLDFQVQHTYGGGFWPDTANPAKNVILFDFGPWVVGKLNGVPKLGLSQWGSSYSPGPVINGQAAMYANPADSLRYRPYKITKGDNAASNPDYRDWPTDLGAPIDNQGNPRFYGDQTVWSVFNNLDTTAPLPWWRSHMPMPGLPVEIQQVLYEHAIPGNNPQTILANVAFVEWTIINSGDTPIESTYVSLWTDIDFNDLRNTPAIDTTNQVGYCWQKYDDHNGNPARAVGFVWLYGPVVPSPGSYAVFKGQQRGDFKNLSLSSFWGIQDDSYPDSSFSGPAQSMGTAWNIARGYDKAGNPILDSVTHQVTRFPYSGDPTTGSGWICPFGIGGAGFNMFSGPFTLAPHDTQWVMAALVPVNNSDRLECIRLLRQRAASLRAMTYQSLVVSSVEDGRPGTLPLEFTLDQNYPNPFNPTTVIRFSVPSSAGRDLVSTGGRDGHVPGVSDVKITVFDVVGREVAVLVNDRKVPGKYEVTFDASRLASGVYFYRMEAGNFVQTRKLCILK